jgi:hypothetical protein
MLSCIQKGGFGSWEVLLSNILCGSLGDPSHLNRLLPLRFLIPQYGAAHHARKDGCRKVVARKPTFYKLRVGGQGTHLRDGSIPFQETVKIG